MKYRVKIEDRYFAVEITDIHACPVVAIVDGREIEVWTRPESEETPIVQSTTQPAVAPKPVPTTVPPAPKVTTNGSVKGILAPLPGVIVAVSVRPGDQVTASQEICVLEAMKMKNAVRSPRPGQIDRVYVELGQHVRHHDVLVDFKD